MNKAMGTIALRYILVFAGTIVLLLLSFLHTWVASLFVSIPIVKNGITLLLPVLLLPLVYLFHRNFSGLNMLPGVTNWKRIRPALLLGGGISAGILGLTYASSYLLGCVCHTDPSFSIKHWLSDFFTQAVISSYEEVIFRGLLFLGLFIRSKNVFVAALVSGVCFSLLHYQTYSITQQWYTHVGMVSAGMVLSYSYVISGSLWAPIALHFTNNFVQQVFTWEDAPVSFGHHTISDLMQTTFTLLTCLLLTLFVYTNRKKYLVPSCAVGYPQKTHQE